MVSLSIHTLSTLVDEFYDYMGRDKKPSKDRIKLWYKKLDMVSETDLYEAFDYMKDTLDSLPFNLPKAIKSAIFEVGRSKPQPESQSPGAYGKCDDCNSTGIFKLRLYNRDGSWHEPITFCGKCDNYKIWVNDPGIRRSAAELSALGILFKPYNRVLLAPGDCGPIGDINKLAAGIGKRIE